MKKSILIVYSLLILPLLTSFITFGMEDPIEIKTTSDDEIERYRKMIKIIHAPVIAELLEQFTHQTTQNIPLNKSNPIEIKATAKPRQIYNETIDIQLPKHIENQYTAVLKKRHTTTPEESNLPSNPLLQSVILPTEEKPLGYIAALSYYTSTSNQIMNSIITQLETKTFDTSDATSFARLKEAISTATKNEDAKSLLKIATLCQENYPNQIRIDNDDLAQQANKFLSYYYTTELNITNELLQQNTLARKQGYNASINTCRETINKTINTCLQEIAKINNRYNSEATQNEKDIKKLRKEISTFAILNRSIRLKNTQLLNENPIKQPGNILATTITQTSNQLCSIQKQLNNIPTIIDSKKQSNLLALEQK